MKTLMKIFNENFNEMYEHFTVKNLIVHLYLTSLQSYFMNDTREITGWSKKLAPFLYALTFTDFQNYFTLRITKKFAIILSLKIPPHLKCVTKLVYLSLTLTFKPSP